MTLQEALKVGRPFKRARWEGYYISDGILVVNSKTGEPLKPITTDLMALDWEVQKESILLTLDEVEGAILDVAAENLTPTQALRNLGFKL